MSQVGSARVGLSSGVRLHYVQQGDPRGEVILLLHGWPDSWFTFSRVLPLLPARYRVLVPDHRGFGGSDRPESGYGIRELADDAAAFLDALSVDRATLVGHSLGSFVARRLAIAHPDRVARLVLIGTGFSPLNPATAGVRSMLPRGDDVPPAFAREFQASTAFVPLPPSFFDRIVEESLKAPARVWRDVFHGLLAYDDTGELRRIEAPALLLWGEHDALFPRGDQELVTAAIPDSALSIYAETGHCPNWERPERVADDLVAFLQRT
jgi:pimeloyl-ACP methyl ester carboxylesterase